MLVIVAFPDLLPYFSRSLFRDESLPVKGTYLRKSDAYFLSHDSVMKSRFVSDSSSLMRGNRTGDFFLVLDFIRFVAPTLYDM